MVVQGGSSEQQTTDTAQLEAAFRVFNFQDALTCPNDRLCCEALRFELDKLSATKATLEQELISATSKVRASARQRGHKSSDFETIRAETFGVRNTVRRCSDWGMAERDKRSHENSSIGQYISSAFVAFSSIRECREIMGCPCTTFDFAGILRSVVNFRLWFQVGFFVCLRYSKISRPESFLWNFVVARHAAVIFKFVSPCVDSINSFQSM